MSAPLKIGIVCPDETYQLLDINDVQEHLKIAFSCLSNIQGAFSVQQLDNLQEKNISDSDQTLFLLDSKSNLNEFLKKLSSDQIKKCILVNPDENFQAINLEFEARQYNFYDIDPETGIKRLYRETDVNTSILYWSGILDIAYDILHSLNKIQKNATIYVAETTPDLFQYRNAVCSELAHRGFNVLPKQVLHGSNDEISSIISKYLDISIMSVHLIGSHYGKVISGSDHSLIELQCRLAAKKWRLSSQAEGLQFNRIIWLPPGIKAADERQQRFFDTLRIEDKNDASEILQVPLEDLKASLRTKIHDLTEYIKPEGEIKKSVYLIHEPKDKFKVEEFLNFFKKNGTEVLTIASDIHPEHIVSKHLEFLTKSSAAIIYDNDCSATWVRSKIKDLIKAPGYGRPKAFLAKALITKNQSKYQTLTDNNDTMLINGSLALDEALIPFTKKLNLEQ